MERSFKALQVEQLRKEQNVQTMRSEQPNNCEAIVIEQVAGIVDVYKLFVGLEIP
jgi:hypothetical protein